MKKRFAALLAAALVVAALAGCGSDQGGTANGTANSATSSTANGSVLGGEAGLAAGGSLTGGTEGSALKDWTVDDGGFNGVSYGQMLRNARVHDTDGDLSDLENAYTPGSLGW